MIIPDDDYLTPWDTKEPRTFRADAPRAISLPVGDRPETVPSFSQTMGAAFRQDNIVGSLLANRDVHEYDRYRMEEGFNPFDELAGTRYEGLEDKFTDIFNRKAFEQRKAQLDMEREDRRTLDAAGFWGDLASVGASIADPTTLLPGGTFYRGIKGGFRLR